VPSFDDYLATLPDAEKAELERIRQVVRRTVPGAELEQLLRRRMRAIDGV
jgi:hypothetical protein